MILTFKTRQIKFVFVFIIGSDHKENGLHHIELIFIGNY